MKNIFFIIISLLLMVGLLYSFSNISTKKISNKTHIVVLNEDGFSPPRLTIRKGETIKFITTRNTPFWPASNPHPIHDIFPQFDPQQPIDSNKSWSFQFNKVGHWKYHDHLAPHNLGEIDVIN